MNFTMTCEARLALSDGKAGLCMIGQFLKTYGSTLVS